jgi:beta-ketodecanoyl-[acyl-carrier-protein] synthase
VKPVISGTGLFLPPDSISNDELVASFNAYVARFNGDHADEIAAGRRAALEPSSVAFIEKASGIRARRVIDRQGILDPAVLCPRVPERSNDEPSLQCDMAVAAAREALARARKRPDEIDAVIVACSNMQRPYPAIAVEVQAALGIERGYGFDLNVACSSATFGIRVAADTVRSGSARAVLVVDPEICTGHLNFADRESHFIFGDACTAIVVESEEGCRAPESFDIVGTRLQTQFSSHIRNNFGFLNRSAPETAHAADKLFVQQGRKVFKDVCSLASDLMLAQLDELGLAPDTLRRLWLHQANLLMNQTIARRVLGRPASIEEAPVILDELGNTSSAGAIIAFHRHRQDLAPGDYGIICSFGAGYSIGSVVVRKRSSPSTDQVNDVH